MSALGIGPELASGFPFDVSFDVVTEPDQQQDATVRDIRSAPSLRAAQQEEEERQRSRRDHPAYRARVQQPNPLPAKSAPTVTYRTVSSSVIGKVAAYVLALVLVVGVGFAAGSLFQPTVYAGETWSRVVEVGDTLPELASLVAADRSTESVMEDIRTLNALQSDLLVPGQVLALPSH